ncbi:MAG: 30S ribosomal protein S9 [Anaerolineae bacterium]|nr:30S ribosomal protein S9 [Anaerolineae bacterium]
MSEVRYYEGVGRRKRSTARVRLYPGNAVDEVNRISINDKPLEEYFGRFQDRQQAIEPLTLTHNEGRYNLIAVVKGGGITGQAQAIRQGLARALQIVDPELRPVLREAGFLTRDSREKERKKVGLKKARKAPQYTKR